MNLYSIRIGFSFVVPAKNGIYFLFGDGKSELQNIAISVKRNCKSNCKSKIPKKTNKIKK